MTGKWNPATKKMEFPKEEAKVAGVAATDITYVPLKNSVIAAIAAVARKDGAQTVKATTPQGEKGQNTRLATPYISALIADFLEARKGK